MKSGLPAYYTSLPPFLAAFDTGNPILTYHKVGPRPPRARLKGLYLPPRLFERQLGELRRAGFAQGSLSASTEPRTGRTIVITFDDGYADVLRHALAPLAANGYRAIQYLVADRLGQVNEWDLPLGEAPEPLMDAAQVRDWLAAGHDIGSHTSTHPHLARLSPDDARGEISSSRKKLEDLFGRPVEHFCYPFGEWNPQVRDWVAAAGYRTACTTQSGVNMAAGDSLTLRRFTARYRSRNLKSAKAWLAERWEVLRKRK